MKRSIWLLMGFILLFSMAFTIQSRTSSLPRESKDESWNLAFKQPVIASGSKYLRSEVHLTGWIES